MIRRFNYTGRKRIRRENVAIKLVGNEPVRAFEAGLALRDYELPPEGRVYVEAYEKAAFMRFDFGTVGSTSAPPESARALTEFGGSDAMRFRVKVVDTQERKGQLLAEADGVLPFVMEESERGRTSLLPVRHADLGQQVWAIDFPESTQTLPVLLINNHIADRTALVRSPMFMSLALPAVLSEILTRVLIHESHTDADDDSWMGRWLQFGLRVLPTAGEPPEDKEEADEWIGRVVREFCSRQKTLGQFMDAHKEEA